MNVGIQLQVLNFRVGKNLINILNFILIWAKTKRSILAETGRTLKNTRYGRFLMIKYVGSLSCLLWCLGLWRLSKKT